MKKHITRKKKKKKTEYSFAELCVRIVCAFICVELLFQGMIYLLSSEFSGWYVTKHGYMMLQLLLICSLVLFELILPLCGRYRKLITISIEASYPLVVLLYVWKYHVELMKSGMVLANDYLEYWNNQFETNYIGFESTEAAGADALIFLIGAVFFLFILLRYVTGIRLFLIMPHLTVFFSGLLVNAVPGWMALALTFTGTIMLYAMPWEKSRVVWQKKRKQKDVSVKTSFRQLFLYFATALFVVIMVSLTGYVFSGIADRIPEKTPRFYAFQEKLEEKVKDLGSLGISFSKESAYVDNSTPKYTGKEVLEITVDKCPSSNIYLKNFSSGTYRNHKWIGNQNNFKKDAKKQGFDDRYAAKILGQQLYDAATASEENTATYSYDKDAYTSVSGTQFPVGWESKYQITYKNSLSRDAFLPYFADLTDAHGAWPNGDHSM